MAVLNITRWNSAEGTGREFGKKITDYVKLRKANGATIGLAAATSGTPGVFYTFNRYEDQGEADVDLSNILDTELEDKRSELIELLCEKLTYTRTSIIVPFKDMGDRSGSRPGVINGIYLPIAVGKARDFLPRAKRVVDYMEAQDQSVSLISATSGNINRLWILLTYKDQAEADSTVQSNYQDPAFLTAWFDMAGLLESAPELQRGTILVSPRE